MGILATAAWLVTGTAFAQLLTPDEISALVPFENSVGLSSTPQEMRASEAARVAESYAPARRRFAGQGARVAGHFLRHTGVPPSNGAYFFVIEAISDFATVQVLLTGLIEPPEPLAGPEFTSGGRVHRLAREEGEIAVALEAALVSDDVSRDPRVAQAFEQAILVGRDRPNDIAVGSTLRAIELLGRCDSDAAREVLRRLASDRDARYRAAAMAALGETAVDADAGLSSRSLLEDSQPAVRIEAARAIGRARLVDAVPALRQAMANERAPHVVDAIVSALAEMRVLPQDRRLCLDVASRGWEPSGIAPAFDCWRQGADRRALVDAATGGEPPVRALAMAALVPRPELNERTLVRLPDRAAPRPESAIDVETGTRLLDSAVEVLSRPVMAFPDRPNAISRGVAMRVTDLLYDFAGGDMSRALAFGDRIRTSDSRSRNDGRIAASQALWRADAASYEAIRRPRQAALAAGLALFAGLFAMLSTARRTAFAALVPLMIWSVWSLFAGGVRELPPLDLAPMTVSGSASLIAALVAALTVWWRARGHAAGPLRGAVAGMGAGAFAAIAAFFACGALRWYRVFPITNEGWELIFDPIGAAMVAAMLAPIAVAVASVSTSRRAQRSPSCSLDTL